jgi:hypothetical protein
MHEKLPREEKPLEGTYTWVGDKTKMDLQETEFKVV